MKLKFWILDINYGLVGSIPEIRLWGIAEDGSRAVVLDRSFRPYFYLLVEEGREEDVKRTVEKYASKFRILKVEVVDKRYFGRPVKALKVTCQIPKDVPRIREEFARLPGVKDVLEADIRFYMRYMIDNDIYPSAWHEVEAEEVEKPAGWDVEKVYLAKRPPKFVTSDAPPPLLVYAFDIECYNKLGEPIAERDPVIIIASVTNKGDKAIFAAEDKNDRTIIQRFVEDLRRKNPDIVVGYNSNRFDWPYLITRARKNKVRLDVSRSGGAPAQSVYGHYSITGRANIDLYDFAEDIYEVKVRTLENVAEYLGVKSKNERVIIEGAYIYKYWDDPKLRPKLIEYAEDDVESTLGLAEKFIPFAIQLSSIVGLPLDQVGAASVGYRVEWHLMRQAFKFNELIPNRIERPYEKYKGAIVLKPKPGVHKNIAVLDFSSMYPNIMITKNISPDTYVPPYEDVPLDEVYVTPEVGHKFRKAPAGFYRRVLERLLEARKRIREKLRELNPESPEYVVLNERQKALKVIANATYGYCGWVGARWYKREVAEATTAWGRKFISETIRQARKIGLDVIYGDTDSVFVRYDKAKVEDLVKWVERELGLEIKIDKIYKKVFFTEAKKRYCGLLPDGRIDVVGLEAVRGDWSDLAKDVQEKVIEIILKEESPQKAIEYVNKVIEDLRKGNIPLHKLIIWKTITKRIEDYEVEAPHVAAAKILVQMGYQISKGEKIGYIVCKDGEKISERAKPYIIVNDYDEVDVEYYINNQIVPAALRILGYFGVKETQLVGKTPQKSLLEFFG
ncbi:MAG TPA: DNA polymerase II [Thermofilum sp.]|nr:DNA polymerase II [Thermofilum sp.]